MKRRRIFLLLALLLVVASASVALFSPRGPKEPVYQGKTFFQWVGAMVDATTPEQSREARAALDAIGTNSLAFLLHDYTRSISALRRRFNAWAGAHPSIKLRFRDDRQLIERAAIGLMILRSNAAPASPVVARYLGDPARGVTALVILSYTGEPAVPHLREAVGSTNPLVSDNAISALRRLRSESKTAERVLREWEATKTSRDREWGKDPQ